MRINKFQGRVGNLINDLIAIGYCAGSGHNCSMIKAKALCQTAITDASVEEESLAARCKQFADLAKSGTVLTDDQSSEWLMTSGKEKILSQDLTQMRRIKDWIVTTEGMGDGRTCPYNDVLYALRILYVQDPRRTQNFWYEQENIVLLGVKVGFVRLERNDLKCQS